MNKEVYLVINTPKAKRNYAEDRKTIRKMCLKNKITYITTLAGALAALKGIESVKHFKKELIEYLSWYNEKRIKVKLKGLTPLQFRNQSLKPAWLKCPIIGVHFKISVFYSRILDKLHFHRVQLRIMGICLFVFLLQIPGLLRLHRL